MRYVGGLLCAAVIALILQFLPQEARPRGGSPYPPLDATGANVVAGRARIIDGDTIEVVGRRIRLEGIDAPEIKQTCLTDDGGSWPAGRIAATRLQRWLTDKRVACRSVGRDKYNRILGRCTVDGRDINAAMIRFGLAWAFRKYSHAYIAQERIAKANGKGIWAANCQTAWDYRKGSWRVAEHAAPNGCAIKGNISRNGRIYHMPWSPWYGRTRIEPALGERWFCDERQALDAGWRPAIVR